MLQKKIKKNIDFQFSGCRVLLRYIYDTFYKPAPVPVFIGVCTLMSGIQNLIPVIITKLNLYPRFRNSSTHQTKILTPLISWLQAMLYIPSTLNIDLILWHTQLLVCAVKSCSKSWVISFTYTLPHTLNCICIILFEFHI